MKRLVGMAIFVGVITQPAVPSYGQRADLSVLEQSIKQLTDPDWKNRSAAFYALLESGAVGAEPRQAVSDLLRKWPERSDAIKLALIDLLERETAFSEESYRKTGVPLGEAHGEFYGNVVEAVVSLRDTRSISALIGAIETGNMVARALAEFGDAALDRLLQVSNSSDDRRRFAATFVLGRMLESQNAQKLMNPASRQKIKQALEHLATNDPFQPVRDAANEALKRLR